METHTAGCRVLNMWRKVESIVPELKSIQWLTKVAFTKNEQDQQFGAEV